MSFTQFIKFVTHSVLWTVWPCKLYTVHLSAFQTDPGEGRGPERAGHEREQRLPHDGHHEQAQHARHGFRDRGRHFHCQ